MIRELWSTHCVGVYRVCAGSRIASIACHNTGPVVWWGSVPLWWASGGGKEWQHLWESGREKSRVTLTAERGSVWRLSDRLSVARPRKTSTYLSNNTQVAELIVKMRRKRRQKTILSFYPNMIRFAKHFPQKDPVIWVQQLVRSAEGLQNIFINKYISIMSIEDINNDQGSQCDDLQITKKVVHPVQSCNRQLPRNHLMNGKD